MSLYTSLELSSLEQQEAGLDLLEVKIFAWESIGDKDWSLFSWYGSFEIKGNYNEEGNSNAKILNVNTIEEYDKKLVSAEINQAKNKIEALGITGSPYSSNDKDKFFHHLHQFLILILYLYKILSSTILYYKNMHI